MKWSGVMMTIANEMTLWKKVKVFVAQACPTLCNPVVYLWNSPDKNTRVGYYSLLQGIFPIQGLNPGLLHCRQVLYHLSYQGSPAIANEMTLYYSVSILLMEFFNILLFFNSDIYFVWFDVLYQ